MDRRTRSRSSPLVGSARYVKVLAAVNLVLGLFLCFARVYVGAHYPGDVVAGYLLAAVAVLAVSLLRPFAYGAVDVVEPTAVGNLLRRPGPASTGGEPRPEPQLGSAPVLDPQRQVAP